MTTFSWIQRAAAAAVVAVAAIAFRPHTAQAQQFEVRGVVVDSAQARVSGAMVVALTRVDSVITVFTTSGGNGSFLLKGLKPGEYILQVTRIGYRPVRRDFVIASANVVADTVVLHDAGPVELDELTVSAEHIPIVNKRDTLEYNADAFKTRVNATVEELLKRLPGVQVASDGSITAQGETVQKVLVDGKEFFGNDPKMATRNLPAAAIDKVQVLDKKSDNAEFTGIDDGNEQKTVNLVLKPGARVGYFGRAVAGVGPAPTTEAAFAGSKGDDMRYSGALNLNRFSPSTQLSVIANRNNTGQSGFSLGAPVAFGVSRGGGGGGSLGDGFSETMALGLNASHDFSQNNYVRSSYFLSTLDNRQNAVTSDQLLQGSAVSALRNETATSDNDNLSHRLNVNAQRAFSAWSQLRFRGNLSISSGNSGSLSQQETRGTDGAFQNRASTSLRSDNDNVNGDARFTLRQRFNQAGRSLIAEGWAQLSSPDNLTRLASSTDLAAPDGGVTTTDLLQNQYRDSQTLTAGQRLALTEPFGQGLTLELYGEHHAIYEDQDYDVDDIGADGTAVPNDVLSRAFERTYDYLQGGTRFSRNTESTRWVVGLEVQKSDLDGKIIDRDESISNGFTNVLPSANVRFQFNQGTNLSLNYRTATDEPSLEQLQPFTDNTNPLNIYVGNPNLVPEYGHSLRAEFRRFDQFTFRNIFLYANVGYSRNRLVQSRTIDAQGRQTVMPINLGDGWTTSAGLSLGTPVRSLGIQADLDYSINRSTGDELVNAVENESQTMNHTVALTLQNRSKDLFDVSVSARLGFNSVHYSLNTALDRDYMTSVFSGNGTLYLSETWTVGASADYQVYDQDLFGPRDNITLLNASLSRQVLAGRGEFRLSGLDLLDQNSGLSISSSGSYIRERRVATLGRRVMMQFSYQLGSNLNVRR